MLAFRISLILAQILLARMVESKQLYPHFFVKVDAGESSSGTVLLFPGERSPQYFAEKPGGGEAIQSPRRNAITSSPSNTIKSSFQSILNTATATDNQLPSATDLSGASLAGQRAWYGRTQAAGIALCIILVCVVIVILFVLWHPRFRQGKSSNGSRLRKSKIREKEPDEGKREEFETIDLDNLPRLEMGRRQSQELGSEEKEKEVEKVNYALQLVHPPSPIDLQML